MLSQRLHQQLAQVPRHHIRQKPRLCLHCRCHLLPRSRLAIGTLCSRRRGDPLLPTPLRGKPEWLTWGQHRLVVVLHMHMLLLLVVLFLVLLTLLLLLLLLLVATKVTMVTAATPFIRPAASMRPGHLLC